MFAAYLSGLFLTVVASCISNHLDPPEFSNPNIAIGYL